LTRNLKKDYVHQKKRFMFSLRSEDDDVNSIRGGTTNEKKLIINKKPEKMKIII